MAWQLLIGGVDYSGALTAGARVTEVVNSGTQGEGAFSLGGDQTAAIASGAPVTLIANGGTIWEGVVTGYPVGQTDSTGAVRSTLVNALPNSSQAAQATGFSITYSTDIALVASQLTGLTNLTWGGPTSFGVSIGSIICHNVADGLTTCATLANKAWCVRSGLVQFLDATNGVTSLPLVLSGIPTSAANFEIRGGIDASTRQPLHNFYISSSVTSGPTYQTNDPDIADKFTLDEYANVLMQRYSRGAFTARMVVGTGYKLRAGDWVVDQNGQSAIVYSTAYTLSAGDWVLRAQIGWPALPIDFSPNPAAYDYSTQNPASRLSGDFLIAGAGVVSTTGLQVQIQSGSFSFAGMDPTVYPTGVVAPGATLTFPASGTFQINALPTGNPPTAASYAFTTNLMPPLPGNGVALYQVTTLGGGIASLVQILPNGGASTVNIAAVNVLNLHLAPQSVTANNILPTRYDTTLPNYASGASNTSWYDIGPGYTGIITSQTIASGDTLKWDVGAGVDASSNPPTIPPSVTLAAKSGSDTQVHVQLKHIPYITGAAGTTKVLFTGTVVGGSNSLQTQSISGSSSPSITFNSRTGIYTAHPGATTSYTLPTTTVAPVNAGTQLSLILSSVSTPSDGAGITSLKVILYNPSGTAVQTTSNITAPQTITYSAGGAPAGAWKWTIQGLVAPLDAGASSYTDTWSGSYTYYSSGGGTGQCYVLAADGVTQRTTTADTNIKFTTQTSDTLGFDVFNNSASTNTFTLGFDSSGL